MSKRTKKREKEPEFIKGIRRSINKIIKDKPELERFKSYLTVTSPTTQRSYLSTAKAFLEFVKKPLDQIAESDAYEFLDHIGKEVSDRSKARYAYAIAALYKCSKKGSDEFLSRMTYVTYREEEPAVLDKDQYERVRSDDKLKEGERLLIETSYECALRIGEACSLTRKSFKGSHVVIFREKHRRRIKEHPVPIPDYLSKKLSEWLEHRTDAYDTLFVHEGRPLHPRTAFNIFVRVCMRSGVYDEVVKEFERPPNFHTLRHTKATHMAMDGKSPYEIKDITGHERVDTVFKYVHLARLMEAKRKTKG